jgi:hypothetical protein
MNPLTRAVVDLADEGMPLEDIWDAVLMIYRRRYKRGATNFRYSVSDTTETEAEKGETWALLHAKRNPNL